MLSLKKAQKLKVHFSLMLLYLHAEVGGGGWCRPGVHGLFGRKLPSTRHECWWETQECWDELRDSGMANMQCCSWAKPGQVPLCSFQGPSHPRWVLLPSGDGGTTIGAAWRCLFILTVQLDAEFSQVPIPEHQIRLLNWPSCVLAVPQNYHGLAFHRHLKKRLQITVKFLPKECLLLCKNK